MSSSLKTPALLFLPGLLCDQRLFQPQINAFEQKQIPWQCIVPTCQKPYTMTHLAQQTWQQCKFESVVLVGLSLGGMLAMEMLAQQPQKVTGVALFSANHLADSPARQSIRRKHLQQIENTGQKGLIKLMQSLVAMLYPPNLSATNKKHYDLIMAMCETVGASRFICQQNCLLERQDQTQTLLKNKHPTLLVGGKTDQICPLSRHRHMQQLMPHATAISLEDVGHLPTLEAAQSSTKILLDWYQTIVP